MSKEILRRFGFPDVDSAAKWTIVKGWDVSWENESKAGVRIIAYNYKGQKAVFRTTRGIVALTLKNVVRWNPVPSVELEFRDEENEILES